MQRKLIPMRSAAELLSKQAFASTAAHPLLVLGGLRRFAVHWIIQSILGYKQTSGKFLSSENKHFFGYEVKLNIKEISNRFWQTSKDRLRVGVSQTQINSALLEFLEKGKWQTFRLFLNKENPSLFSDDKWRGRLNFKQTKKINCWDFIIISKLI